jgi:hypothetical protein
MQRAAWDSTQQNCSSVAPRYLYRPRCPRPAIDRAYPIPSARRHMTAPQCCNSACVGSRSRRAETGRGSAGSGAGSTQLPIRQMSLPDGRNNPATSGWVQSRVTPGHCMSTRAKSERPRQVPADAGESGSRDGHPVRCARRTPSARPCERATKARARRGQRRGGGAQRSRP